jgi:sugar-specific transcriptional regulator TrmB
MNSTYRAKLEKLGLSPAEAQVYLAVLRHGPLAAAAIAQGTGIARTSIYPIICSLADKGLLESGIGYGSKFAAVPPDEALSSLISREKHILAERESVAAELSEILAPLAAEAESDSDDLVQVIRTPHAITQRYERLQLEAEGTVDTIVKTPILNPRKDNPAQARAQQRGVHYRALYEKAAVEDAEIKPYLQAWIVGGEEARVYDSKLPYKLTIFDAEIALITLTKRGDTWLTLFVKHEPLAKSLTEWFNLKWEKSKPLRLEDQLPIPAIGKAKTDGAGRRISQNGRRGQHAKK